MSKNEISILIPVYNTVCVDVVQRLLVMCEEAQERRPDLRYEVVVADDASPDRNSAMQNREIRRLPNCRYIEKESNSGSAATRNLLAREARYRWLLFMDCDLRIENPDFIVNYLSFPGEGIINGGIAIGAGDCRNLRFLYEKSCEQRHTAAMRSQRPYQAFRSANFMADRAAMLRCPFDERFKKSGYEDVMLGKQLASFGIPVHHIDNPTVMVDFEDNAAYVAKIERSMRTLHDFRQELQGYSRIITLGSQPWLAPVRCVLRLWHLLLGSAERRNLCGDHPNLTIFKLYKIGYYLTLKNQSVK
ncbi:MAG: glycosyltransferase [Prevotella sp.]|nr:glycosyltransferase [Prevotella sp.]